MARVYVSSTFEDLRECREKVRLILQQLGHTDVAMETYVAGSERPVEKCLADVAASDLYIGIFAWRHGYIPAGHKLSITELEYRAAVNTIRTASSSCWMKMPPGHRNSSMTTSPVSGGSGVS